MRKNRFKSIYALFFWLPGLCILGLLSLFACSQPAFVPASGCDAVLTADAFDTEDAVLCGGTRSPGVSRNRNNNSPAADPALSQTDNGIVPFHCLPQTPQYHPIDLNLNRNCELIACAAPVRAGPFSSIG